MYASIAAVGSVRDPITLGAQGWARSVCRADTIVRRSDAFQSPATRAGSTSLTTPSATASSKSSLSRTWWYSDIGSTPSVWASRRIDNPSAPSRSARSIAAATMRSRLSGEVAAGPGYGRRGVAAWHRRHSILRA